MINRSALCVNPYDFLYLTLAIIHMTKKEVDTILSSIGYYDSFKKLINEQYIDIDYGKRLGVISFDSLFDADKKYKFNGEVDIEQF